MTGSRDGSRHVLGRFVERVRHGAAAGRRRLAGRPDQSSAQALLPWIVAFIDPDRPSDAYRIVRAFRSRGGTTVVELGLDAAPTVIVKIAGRRNDGHNLRRQARVLRAISRRLAGSDIEALVPQPLGSGRIAGRQFAVESRLPGQPASTLTPPEQLQVLTGAADAIRALHAATEQVIDVDERFVARWLLEPAATLDRRLAREPGSALLRVGPFARRLADEVRGARLSVGWIHGDYWLGNVLVDDALQVTGLVDWDSAATRQPGAHDLAHLVVTARRQRLQVPWGVAVTGLLTGDTPNAAEQAVLDLAGASLGELSIPTMLRLYWLETLAASVRRHPTIVERRGWLDVNVDIVLHAAS